jgi:osmotically-inducible protein OsmY
MRAAKFPARAKNRRIFCDNPARRERRFERRLFGVKGKEMDLRNFGSFARLVVVLGATALLPGCVVAALGGAAATGGYAAGQERGVSGTVKDTGIKTSVKDKFFRYNVDMSNQIDTTVWEGEVLLTGAVANPEWRDEASRLAWQVDGVKAVHNELEVSDRSSMWDGAKDSWITTRLRSAITLDSQIRSLNYAIETANANVYVMGAARTQGELDLVTNYARNIPNVKKVVSYAHVRPGEPTRDAAPVVQQPAPAAGASSGYAPPPPSSGYTPPTPSSGYAPPTPAGAPVPIAPAPGGPAGVEKTPLS